MAHVFYFSDVAGYGLSGDLRLPFVRDFANMTEWYQESEGYPSGFSYEDMPSDKAGIDFAREYGRNVDDGLMTMEEAMADFLVRHGGTDPERAPNFDYIPYRADHNVPKVRNFTPLTGERLEAVHREIYENRDADARASLERGRNHIRR